MADSSIHNFSSKTPDESLAESPEDMAALRSLLLGFEQSELEQRQERLNNPNINAEDLSRLLPEAIVLLSMQDKLLSEAIVYTVEEAIHSSVKKDLNILSEAIFLSWHQPYVKPLPQPLKRRCNHLMKRLNIAFLLKVLSGD